MDTKPPPWQEPPVFSLPHVSSPEIPALPGAYAVLIHGIDGTTRPQLLESSQPTFISDGQNLSFNYKPSKIMGEHASGDTISEVATDLLDFLVTKLRPKGAEVACPSSIIYFAYDVGGIVVKQALAIASLNEQYRTILDQTSLVVFFGTPHRSSDSQTWAINTLQILHSCFRGVLGSWVPTFVEKISNYQQRLNDEFRGLASEFRVMNVCQKSGSPNHDLVTHPSCAMVGLDTETTVLLDRSHYQLGFILGHQQREYMERRMLDAMIRHWKVYQKFIDTLRFDCGELLSSPRVDRRSQTKSLELFLSKPSAQAWKEASSPSTIRLVLGERIGFEDFYHSFSSHVATADEGKESVILRLGPDHPCRAGSTVHQLYASLCLQLLEQHPSLILWIRHLYPNLRDAILGVDGRWKLRALRRCLTTLLLIPKYGATYCLIYHSSEGSREDVIAQILAVTKESEIPFRFLVYTPPKTEMELIAHCACVDLSSEGGMVGMAEDRESTQQGQTEDQSTRLWAKMVARNHSSPATHGGAPDSEMGISQNGLMLTLSSNHIFASPEQMLSICADNGMTWALRCHPPLITNRDGTSFGGRRGKILLHVLELSLPGLFSIAEDSVWASPQLWSSLTSIWAKYFSDGRTPELYIAQACFAMTATLFQDRSPTATTDSESKTNAAADSGPPESPSANSVKSQQQAMQPRQHTAGQVIVEYANRYWMEHHLRATLDVGGATYWFRRILDMSPRFDRNAWIQHLASLYWSPEIGEGLRTKVQPNFTQESFDLSSFDACYISFRMATLPINVEDDFNWLLLGLASERMPEASYFSMILKVCETLSDTSLADTLQRVVAAAPVNLRKQLLTEFDRFDFLRKSFVDIMLTSIAIGNTSAVTDLLTMIPSYSLGHKQEDMGASSLGTALQVACEYGDRDVVQRILQFEGDASPFHLEGLYSWNALHVACHQGNSSLVGDLMNSLQRFENKNRRLDAGLPSQLSPLLITSARGLFAISKSLKPLGVNIPVDEENSMSAMQLASKYGFLKTLDSLLHDHSNKVSLKSRENSALCLALKSGNDEVAVRVFRAFVDAVTEAYNEMSPVHRNDDRNYDSDDSDSSMSDSAVDDSPVVAVNEIVLGALLAAVERGAMPSIFESLRRSNLKSKLADSKGRTPLMLAAMIRSVAITKRLYVKGDDTTRTDKTGRTAMHHACYHGHLAVVEFLA